MNQAKKALITGISGQDGYYLSSELRTLGYEVLGLTRNSSNSKNVIQTNYSRSDLQRILTAFKPTEIYHFAAQPYVGKSWDLIDETLNGTAVLTAHLLEELRFHPEIKFFNASSSEIYADTDQPTSENSEMNPTNPYGCAKLFSYQMVKAYRENYGLFAVNGILFNHESERRYSDFFSQKLVNGVLDVYTQKTEVVRLGNLDVVRDWGSAEEYMSVVPKLMQMPSPTDVNICSSQGKKVLDLVKYTFGLVNLDHQKHVAIDKSFVRNKEKRVVIGSNQKISDLLNWSPQVSIESVLKKMLVHAAQQRGIREIS